MVFSSLIFLYGFFSISLLAYALCRTQRDQNTVLLLSTAALVGDSYNPFIYFQF